MAAVKYSLDTNLLLRLIIDDVPAQAKAVQNLVDTHYDRQLAVADAVIIEMSHVLAHLYQFDRQTIVRIITSLLGQPAFNCNQVMFREALRHYSEKPALSFVDCCLAEYAKLDDRTLLTFDRKLAKQSPHAQLLAA